MLLRESPDLTGLPDDLRPLIESCMQMDASMRPSPADLQAQLAPHLFASGGGDDDGGTASAWLPTAATAMIERRRGGGRTAPPAAPPAAPPRPADPAPSRPAPARQESVATAPHRPPGTDWEGSWQGGAPAAPVPDAGGPVRLTGAQVPIGPGPRAQDVRASAAAADAGPATGWVRPPAGVQGTAPAPVPAPAPAPDSGQSGPARWRPWRFRMSNDVWGTPVVVGDLLYVTSFEVHALDTGNGRRQFKTRDVAWAMAVEGGRIHASDGPSLYALDATTGAERWRTGTDAWVYALKADRGTVVTATRGGGVQAWEAATGEKLWDLTGAQTDFETPEGGPVIHDGTVYVWQDARLKALDARTGAERWSYPVGDAASCGGVPVRVTAGAGRLRVRRRRDAGPRGGHHLRARPLALRVPGRLPLPARLRPRPGRHRRRDLPRGLPRHGVRPGRRDRQGPLAHRHGGPPVGGAGARRRGQRPCGQRQRALHPRRGHRHPEVAVRHAAARWSAPPSSPTAASTSAPRTTSSTPSTRRAASSAGSSPPAARSPARRWPGAVWCTRAARTAACTRWTR